MSWFEVLTVAVGVGLAVLAASGRRKNLRWGFAGVAVAFAVAEFVLLGPRWEMVPVFAAMAVSFALMFVGGSRGRRRAIGVGCTLLCALSLVALWALPVFSLPKPTGPNAVGTRTLDVKGDGGREVVVQVWYPAVNRGGESVARYARLREVKPLFAYWSALRTNSLKDAPKLGVESPVVVFGPRWGGRRGQDTFLAEELASYGYVVAAVDHPGNAALVELSDGRVVRSQNAGALDNVEGSGRAAVEALWAKELAVWTADDEMALDRLQQEEWLVDVDWSHVGALGHSFGGASSMALLGVDQRVKCAVNLDGWTFNGLDHRTTEPVMFVYEGVAEEPKPPIGVGGELDRDDNAAVEGSLRKYGGIRAYVAGTQHLDFTDQTLVSPIQRLTYTGPIQGTRVRTILRGMVVGFFDGCLKGSGAVPDYPEVKMERYSGEPH